MRVHKFHGALAVAVLLSACASQEPAPAPVQPAPAPVVAAAPRSSAPMVQTARPYVQSAPAPVVVDPLNDPKSALARRSVYYDYDEATLKPADRALVEEHAKYLKAHRERHVVIEGNCDERGSREYNLALGQRRADAVRSMMVLAGASDKQVEAVSLGEEKPRASGHDETAWAQNRRSDIVYKASK